MAEQIMDVCQWNCRPQQKCLGQNQSTKLWSKHQATQPLNKVHGGVLGLVSPHMWAAKGRQANALSTIPSSQVFPILGAANHYFIIQPGNILVLLPPAIYTCWETQTNDRACFRISLGLQETCVTLEMPQYIFTSAWYWWCPEMRMFVGTVPTHVICHAQISRNDLWMLETTRKSWEKMPYFTLLTKYTHLVGMACCWHLSYLTMFWFFYVLYTKCFFSLQSV